MGFAEVEAEMNNLVASTFGQVVTHTTARNVATELTGVLDTGVLLEGVPDSVNAVLFAPASAFASAPVAGERITTAEGTVYAIHAVEYDGPLAINLKLRKVA